MHLMRRLWPRRRWPREDKSYMKGQKTLEINPRHPIVQELRRQVPPFSHCDLAKCIPKVLCKCRRMLCRFSGPDSCSACPAV